MNERVHVRYTACTKPAEPGNILYATGFAVSALLLYLR